MLGKDVVPFFEQFKAMITTVLSDNGGEFCGRPDRHSYELFLHLKGIKYLTTKVCSLQSNVSLNACAGLCGSNRSESKAAGLLRVI